MAVSATTRWNMRSGGSANNGGGFDPDTSALGVNYTRQDAAQLVATDLACANTITLTSAAAGFTRLMLGNYIHLTAGTNVTVGFYRIVTFNSASSVDLDRNPTNGTAFAGATGRVGGALVLPATISGIAVPGNIIFMDEGLVASVTTASLRNKWRRWTGEVYSNVVTDAEVDDVWIQAGLRDLSRRVRYHYTDDTTSITLVAGTQEYALPAGCNEVIHVYLSGQELKKASIDEWRNHGIAWRQQSGTPSEWAMYGDRIVFWPIPNAAAVAADDNPDLRFVSDPRAFSIYGPEQLRSQDHDIPIYRAVALWSASYPDSAAAQMRREKYDKLFDDESQLVAAYYAARVLEK